MFSFSSFCVFLTVFYVSTNVTSSNYHILTRKPFLFL